MKQCEIGLRTKLFQYQMEETRYIESVVHIETLGGQIIQFVPFILFPLNLYGLEFIFRGAIVVIRTNFPKLTTVNPIINHTYTQYQCFIGVSNLLYMECICWQYSIYKRSVTKHGVV